MRTILLELASSVSAFLRDSFLSSLLAGPVVLTHKARQQHTFVILHLRPDGMSWLHSELDPLLNRRKEHSLSGP